MTVWDRLLDRLAAHVVRSGTLEIHHADGTRRRHGDGTGPPVVMRIHDPGLARRIVTNPDLGIGEGYMDAAFTLDADDLPGFLALALRNAARVPMPWFERPMGLLRHLGRRLAQFNPRGRAEANVAHHYDLSGKLYDLFLDPDRQYSCAYFRDPGMTLDDAQAAKKDHIARKLRITPGMTVLDIGCGWGGMALTLARDHGARVVGVTLSTEQHAHARRRVRDAGLQDRIDIRLCDYRAVTGTFDRIVSVGMFEHVGLPHYREYFGHLRDRLAPGGVALIHFIGRAAPPGVTSDWVQKYIFPGGYCPAMSETSAAVERENLIIADLEIWRLHYAETLLHWRRRFEARLDAARLLYDDRFIRMWRFYLISSEMAFRHAGQVVFQYQLCHDVADVPLTRDYLYPPPAAEDRRMAAE